LPSQKKRQVGKDLEAKLPKVSKALISFSLIIPRRNLYNLNTTQGLKDLILKDQILKVLELNPSYGHRRIALALEIGKKRTRRVMRLNRKAGWTKKKDYGKPPSGYPNLAGDFTRLVWNGRIIYLATFIDLYTGEIVGWSVSMKHTTEFERFETIGEFVEAIHQTINYYNKERIHTKLKMSPIKFKLKFLTLNMWKVCAKKGVLDKVIISLSCLP